MTRTHQIQVVREMAHKLVSRHILILLLQTTSLTIIHLIKVGSFNQALEKFQVVHLVLLEE